MKKIILHGYLKDLLPEPIEVEAETAAEAIRALGQYPGFRPGDGQHLVKVPGFESRDSLFVKTRQDEIHLVPTVAGGGGGGAGRPGVLQIVIGIVLVVVGIIVNIISPGNPIGASLIVSGAAMILGGIIQLLMKQPEVEKDETMGSKILSSDKNTVKIGTPIPMIFGRCKHAGHYLSFNVNAIERDS